VVETAAAASNKTGGTDTAEEIRKMTTPNSAPMTSQTAATEESIAVTRGAVVAEAHTLGVCRTTILLPEIAKESAGAGTRGTARQLATVARLAERTTMDATADGGTTTGTTDEAGGLHRPGGGATRLEIRRPRPRLDHQAMMRVVFHCAVEQTVMWALRFVPITTPVAAGTHIPCNLT